MNVRRETEGERQVRLALEDDDMLEADERLHADIRNLVRARRETAKLMTRLHPVMRDTAKLEAALEDLIRQATNVTYNSRARNTKASLRNALRNLLGECLNIGEALVVYGLQQNEERHRGLAEIREDIESLIRGI